MQCEWASEGEPKALLDALVGETERDLRDQYPAYEPDEPAYA